MIRTINIYRWNYRMGKILVYSKHCKAYNINGKLLGKYKTKEEAEKAIFTDDDLFQAKLINGE